MPFVISAGALSSLDRQPLRAVSPLALSNTVREDYATIWRTQPNVRTCVSFLARNIAQLGIHVYERISDVDRARLTDHPLAQLLAKPNLRTTRYRLFDSLVHDLAIQDNAYWAKLRGEGASRTNALLRLNPATVTPQGDTGFFAAEAYEVRGSRGKRVFPAEQIVHFHGYNPEDARIGISPIESLRRVLAEEYQAAAYREQLWRNGARFGGYLKRPLDAPDWAERTRERFRSQWQAQYTGDSPNAGGTPILEDGMEWVAGGMTPEQAQYLEARKLTREEVAAAYHIPLPMVGILDHATFSNITEQHKQLYQDTLGPWLTMICEDLELQLLPDLDPNGRVYVEFNMAEKLRGSFEEQAHQLQTAVGAPWLTRNEARARQNLGQVEGGDELITPLNVLVGGQASPTDSAPETATNARPALNSGVKTSSARSIKAYVGEAWERQGEKLLQRFFDRQKAALLSRLGAKADSDLWDEERWNRELADDLLRITTGASSEAAATALAQAGRGEYDEARTLAYQQVMSAGIAQGVNGATRAEVEAALDADDPQEAVRQVFDDGEVARAGQVAATVVTAAASFGTAETVRQNLWTASKTWRTSTRTPRQSHAALSGTTIPFFDKFGNGGMWPGDDALSADERAGCKCRIDITLED